MKQTRLIMGMPITIEITDKKIDKTIFDKIYDYFKYIDNKYSTYKTNSEITKINNGLPKSKWSAEMKHVIALCNGTKKQTYGYFDIRRNGKIDPSGLVKGWAIKNASDILKESGVENFYIDGGGDIQVNGTNHEGEPWTVGIRNPFDRNQIIKVLSVNTQGVATSGTAIRGGHIYNPLSDEKNDEIVSLTLIGPNIYDADRFATSAFAMGEKGINFIESLKGYEGYMVAKNGMATFTSGFEGYTA